jgi:hypothetical protein
MQKITEEELADILEASTIIGTSDRAGMRINSIEHPTIGNATTVQADSGALLIKSL